LEYVKLCDERGYDKELREMSQKWGFMLFERPIYPLVKKLPHFISLNILMKRLFKHMGYMDSVHFSKNGNIVKISTRNEENVKTIGTNSFNTGLYMGILSKLFSSQIEFLDAREIEKGDCEYKFRILNEPLFFSSKDKHTYDMLNHLPIVRGPTLKDALKSNIFKIVDNRIYFRGRIISSIENTIFHLFGDRKILLKDVSKISYGYFKDIVEKASSNEEKLNLIKFLLQVMGWGVVKIVVKKKQIIFSIDHPPYGFQTENDNWDFLIRVILGYLWLLDRNFKIKKVKTGCKKLCVEYSV
jgi:hypothetical protein